MLEPSEKSVVWPRCSFVRLFLHLDIDPLNHFKAQHNSRQDPSIEQGTSSVCALSFLLQRQVCSCLVSMWIQWKSLLVECQADVGLLLKTSLLASSYSLIVYPFFSFPFRFPWSLSSLVVHDLWYISPSCPDKVLPTSEEHYFPHPALTVVVLLVVQPIKVQSHRG